MRMNKELEDLLKTGNLSESAKTVLREALLKQEDEAKKKIRDEIETEVREDYAKRFSIAKQELVDATDAMVTEAIQGMLKESNEAKQALKDELTKAEAITKKVKAEEQAKAQQHCKMVESFVLNVLKEEIEPLLKEKKLVAKQKDRLNKKMKELQEDNQKLTVSYLRNLNSMVTECIAEEINKIKIKEQASISARNSLNKTLKESIKRVEQERKDLMKSREDAVRIVTEHKENLNKIQGERLQKMERFIIENVSQEVAEFRKDRENLETLRVKLFTESAAKMKAFKQEFIARATPLIESTIKDSLREEIKEMRRDITEARKNHFGRRMYEAFKNEFLVSHFNESEELKHINEQIAEKNAQLLEAQRYINDSRRIVEEANKRIKLAEAKAERVKIMSSLLAPLDKSKRVIMEGLLEPVETKRLEESFDKFLPHVIQGGKSEKPVYHTITPQNNGAILSENRTRIVPRTGDKVPTQPSKEIINENHNDVMSDLIRLAGI